MEGARETAQVCRLCKNIIKKSSPRYALFKVSKHRKNDENNDVLAARLHSLGLKIDPAPSKSSIICQPCYRAIPRVEQYTIILKSWKKAVTEDDHASQPLEIKRGLSPSSRWTPGRHKKTKVLEDLPEREMNLRETTYLDFIVFEDAKKAQSQRRLFSLDKLPTQTTTDTASQTDSDTETIDATSKAACREIAHLAQYKGMTDSSTEAIINFSDENFIDDMKKWCRSLITVLNGALGLTAQSTAKIAVKTLCIGALFKSRYESNKVCVIARRNDQLLIAACVRKRAFHWFNKMGLTNSYETAIRQNKLMASGHDNAVKEWKSKIEAHLQQTTILQAMQDVVKRRELRTIEYQHIAQDGKPLVISMTAMDAAKECTKGTTIPSTILECAASRVEQLQQTGKTLSEAIEAVHKEAAESSRPHYQVIGDNLDITLTTRSQGLGNPNKSYHWFHNMAVLDRLDPRQDEHPVTYYSNKPILPGLETQQMLQRDFSVIIIRVLVTYIDCLKPFSTFVPWHINHKFSEEMSRKSTVVPLGLIFESENESTGMISIIKHVQEHWVPMKHIIIDGKTEKEVAEVIPFGGDQLTEERGINVQKAMLDGDTVNERLMGVEFKFEDWHLKKTMYQIKDTIFRVQDSGAQFGTTTWAMNVLHTSNAKKGPHDDFNSYRDFSDQETDSQIIAACMEVMNMETVTADIVPEHIKNGSEDEKRSWVFDIAKQIIERYVVTYDIESTENATQPKSNEKQSRLVRKYYWCHYNTTPDENGSYCTHSAFTYKAARDSHEAKKHNYVRGDGMVGITCTNTDISNSQDAIFNYTKASISFNLLLRDINDCIKEGDGERLMDLYRVCLLYMKAYNHKKYAFTIMKLLTRIKEQPENAFRLIWNRFINTKGQRGKNISNDIHLEHLNGYLKDMLKSLGNNLDKRNADRVSKTVKNLSTITSTVEELYQCPTTTGHRKAMQNREGVMTLANAYKEALVFQEIPGRFHESFPKFDADLLKKLDWVKFVEWMKEKEKEFKYLYTGN